MGLNAQTTVPTFTTGQVLTATQMNESARTGVPVFADTTARDAGFGGTGEKTLAEGQLCYLESTNVVQYYDGAVWAIVGPQTSSFVRVGGSSFSAVASVAYDGVFTATYRNYVIIGNVLVSAGTPAFGFQLNSAGTPDTADYLYQTVRGDGTAISGGRSATQSSAQVINSLDTTHYGAFTLTLYNPAVAIRTAYTNLSVRFSTSTTAVEVVSYGGGHNDAGAFDGIDFLPASGNITGVINIYGVTDS
jgi:hypothetical protein